jgi:hypothetical protein
MSGTLGKVSFKSLWMQVSYGDRRLCAISNSPVGDCQASVGSSQNDDLSSHDFGYKMDI